MFSKNKVFTRFLSLLICITLLTGLMTGCGSQTPQVSPKDDADFDAWVNDLFIESITENTMDLHYTLEDPKAYGITDYPVTLGHCSKEAADESVKEDKTTLAELKAFDYDGLTDTQKLTYDILKDRLELSIESADYPYYDELLSPMIGLQSNLPSLLAEYTLNTKQDVEDYLGLLADVPRYFKEVLTYEQEKSQAGLFMSDKILDMLESDLDSFIQDADNSFLLDTFKERIVNVKELTKKQQNAYCKQNETLVKTDMVTAYKDLKSGMEALRGTGKNDSGLGNFKKGKKYYRYLLRLNVGTDKSVAKLERQTKKMVTEDLDACSEYYYTEDSGSEDQMTTDNFSFSLTDPNEILEDLQQKMLKDFPELTTDVNLSVKTVSKSMEESTSPAYYLVSALDNLKDNVIYINYGLSEKNTLYSTLAHEGYPGHLYQTVYSGTYDPTPIRRLMETSGFSEGWATYVENLSYYYDSNVDQDLLTAMQKNNSGSLGLYALADYYINYEKCSKNEIRRWISNYMVLDDDSFDEFYYMILSQPANYLNYYVGYLEILNLKKKAEKRLGDDFDLKAFHTYLLQTGNAPFYIIEDHMEDWLTQQENETDRAA